MRIVLYTYCIALLCACHNEVDKPLDRASPPKKSSRYASILAKCKLITIDTLLVNGFEYNEDGTNSKDNYQYKGVDVDTAEARLFPAEITEAFMNGGGEIAACYSFAIDESRTGIIARTPSMYESSSIKLLMLNNEKDSMTHFVELAEIWGDAGDAVNKQSWLYRDNKMNLQAYMWIQESYDHSVENENDTTVETNNYHYVLDLSKPQYDTINRNAGALLKTFQAVNRN
jgi:hypothetical protein